MTELELLEKIATLQVKRDRIATMFDEQIEFYRAQLFGLMQALGHEKVSTTTHSAQIRSVGKAVVGNWTKLFNWVAEHKAFDLFERRLSVKGLAKRLEAGEQVPEVTLSNADTLFVVKLKEQK